jgi:NAD+ synthetase
MRLALAQIDTTAGDIAGNRARVLGAIERARGGGADLVVFPELALVGYPPRDLLERRALANAAAASLELVVRAVAGGPAVLVGSIDWPDALLRPRNVAHLIHAGRVETIAKRLLPTYDVFDEARHFSRGSAAQAAVFPIAGVRVGVLICEDQWTDPRLWGGRRMYEEDPTTDLGRAGAELVVNLSASPFSSGKAALRAAVVRAHATTHGVAAAICNLVGGNDSLVFDGGSLLVDADGRLAGAGAPFAEDLLWASFDPTLRAFGDLDAPSRARAAAIEPAFPDGRICHVRLADDEIDDIERALTLGLAGYAGKLGFTRALVGLSGGVDSALVAYLAARVFGGDAVDAVELPSRFTSPLSREIAATLRARLGLRGETIDIEPVMLSFLRQLEPAFAGTRPDVAEENLQARIRGTLLMALSNKFGHLLLSTGNKSEMAVGYCTLYGDMNGGLGLISDVFKQQVYAMCRRINARAGEEVVPTAVLERAPSAELRADQRDEDNLPPYALLDPILVGILEDRLEDAPIARATSAPLALVARVRRMTEAAEFKRFQAPPTIRVSRKAWHGRRYPIVQRFSADA